MNITFRYNNAHYVEFSRDDAIAAGVPADVVDSEIYNEKLRLIREKRTKLITNVQFEYERNNRQIRLGLEPTRDRDWMTSLDEYVQQLADITDSDDIENITWPEQPK